ncbi:sterol desaturase family protein [Solirubrum puertoriconensis]|uniref:Fatty acid hydroxylase n=1 Tax=Solirubrum puertoriconensis TaxID=1751427 RepID=A0A9X0L5L5_SOLP1|nr:sterol desaturase family protein [Solirubrum puertoriconensis]KUG08854.1 fatty acid hydroxylase [Solirubrum puertoriconensis]
MRVEELERELVPLVPYFLPIVVLSVAAEWYLLRHDPDRHYDAQDLRSSIGIGLGNALLNVLLKSGIFGFGLFFCGLAPWQVPPTWWAWVLAYVVVDFCNYLAHYVAHRQRVWWATHVTHHSSEHLNFSTSFRNSWTQHFKIIFFIPAWLTGIHPVILFTCYEINLLYQFWIHTESIGRLPRWFELVFVTPSHHRVHHGRNPKYVDKNFGTTLILWDRLFGTFQQEDEKPIYGITKPLKAPQSLLYLNFHEWADLWHDLRAARSWRACWQTLFGPP